MGISYLLDTHILLWWLFDDPKLDDDCRDIIRNSDHRIYVSSASAWEISTKHRIGKLPEAEQLVSAYSETLNKAEFVELSISTAHALRAGNLPIAHRDRFDQMLMAQSEREDLPILTYEAAFLKGLIQVIPAKP